MKEKIWLKIKESFSTAAIAALMLVIVFLLIWIPFKFIPGIFSKGTNYVATSLSSTFIPGENKATTSPTKNNTQPTNTTVAGGKPDLSVRLISTGIINRYTKQFSQTSTIGTGDEVGMRFEVKNIGNTVSGAWSLKATLPSATTPNYNSDLQRSLNPGDRIEFTLGFDNPTNLGLVTAYVYADPANTIGESNESNNSIGVPFNIVSGSTYGYNYGTTYNNAIGTTYTWTSIVGACSALPGTVYTGTLVNWNASATGGNGYFTYSWNGSDNLVSTEKNPTKIYYTAGVKTGTVTITSNGSSVTKQCTVNVVDQYNNYNTSSSDLSLSLVGVGSVDNSGQFIQSSQVSRGGNIAIKVRITNVGTSYSGNWTITGSVSPSLPGYTYRQDNQVSLAPNSTSDYTMVFWNPQTSGDNAFNIQISQSGNDLNSTNNNLTATVRVY
ncbi:MAG: CARDB domain-containing protein [Candidatus Paceibacterota bacterium]|jgi:hypothetical protein